MRFFITILLLTTVYSFGFDYNLRAYTITEGVSCFFGINENANIKNGGRITNTCYVETQNGYIVIDSGPTYSYAKQAYTHMQKKRTLPIRYVINTSAHEIKVLGNKFYKEHGAILIGPQSYKILLQREETELSTKISKEAYKNTSLIPLDKYLDSDNKISMEDTTIEIKRIETKDNMQLIIFIPEKEIIFVGDYIYNKERYKIDNQHSLLKIKKTISKIKKLEWQYIISSRSTKIGRDIIKETQSYLNAIIIPIKRNRKDRKRYRRKRSRKRRAVIKFA
jgi:glyoxylase-like metal-dependent hydrolase (beta-lactamase superfamily II)